MNLHGGTILLSSTVDEIPSRIGSRVGPVSLNGLVRGFMKIQTRPRIWIPGIRGRAAGACALALAILLGLTAVAAPSAQAQTFDAPGAGTGPLQGTASVSINTAGDVTGIYYDASNLAHGFVRFANGTIKDFDAPGAGTGLNQGTFPTSINAVDQIAGMYSDASNSYHGFLRASNGTITPFDIPGAGTGKHQGVQAPLSINTNGEITGAYKDASDVYHGFIRLADGTINSFDAPGAGTSIYQGTKPISINAAGAVTGGYLDASYLYHGFMRPSTGPILTFDAPGAGGTGSYKGLGNGTEPLSINTLGVVAGNYTDASGARHGFVRAVSGAIKEFNAPGTGTAGIGINAAGASAGAYGDATTLLHGFVRAPNGTITTFDIPGAAAGLLIGGTGGFSINTAGQVTGTYSDASDVFHGFVLTPTTTTLSSSLNPSIYGQVVTLTAVVTSIAGAPANGETVTFMEGTKALGTGTLSGGSASLTISTLKAGTNVIKAVYGSGDSNFLGSTSKSVSQVVSKATTKTALASSLNPSNVGQAVTFTARVAPQFSGTVTGTVTFYDGTTALKTVALSGGVAKCATSSLTKGGHTITATYSGSTSFDGSSTSLTQTVN